MTKLYERAVRLHNYAVLYSLQAGKNEPLRYQLTTISHRTKAGLTKDYKCIENDIIYPGSRRTKLND